MNFIIAYFKGWWLALRSIKIWSVHYLFLLLLGLLSTLPFFQLMESKLGRSLAIEKLMPGFDYTVFQDFMNVPEVKGAFGAIMGLNQLLLVLFFLLITFLTGGVLHVYRDRSEGMGMRRFFSGATYYFWRMLRLTIYFSLVHAFIIALFFQIFQFLTAGGFATMGSELGYIDLLKIMVPVYLLVASWFFMVQDYAKIRLVDRDRTFLFSTFWSSFGFTFRYFFHTFLLYILNAATFIGLVALFYYGSQLIMADSPDGIALSLLMGQGFVLGRIFTRLLNLASASLLYHGIQDKRKRKAEEKEKAEQARLQAIAIAEQEAADAKIQAERAAATALAASATAQAAETKAQTLQDQNFTPPPATFTTTPDLPEAPTPPAITEIPEIPPMPEVPTINDRFAAKVDEVGLNIPEIPDLGKTAPEQEEEEEIEIPPMGISSEEEE